MSIERRFAVNRLREIAARSLQRLDERGCAQFSEIFRCVVALVARGPVGTMPVVQEEIFAAQRRNTGVFKNFVGEIFVGCQRRGGGIVLRIPRASPGAEMNGFGWRSDAEDQSAAAVEVPKCQAEFGGGKCRIDRLIRIGARLSRSKFPGASHAISGGLGARIGCTYP